MTTTALTGPSYLAPVHHELSPATFSPTPLMIVPGVSGNPAALLSWSFLAHLWEQEAPLEQASICSKVISFVQGIFFAQEESIEIDSYASEALILVNQLQTWHLESLSRIVTERIFVLLFFKAAEHQRVHEEDLELIFAFIRLNVFCALEKRIKEAPEAFVAEGIDFKLTGDTTEGILLEALIAAGFPPSCPFAFLKNQKFSIKLDLERSKEASQLIFKFPDDVFHQQNTVSIATLYREDIENRDLVTSKKPISRNTILKRLVLNLLKEDSRKLLFSILAETCVEAITDNFRFKHLLVDEQEIISNKMSAVFSSYFAERLERMIEEGEYFFDRGFDIQLIQNGEYNRKYHTLLAPFFEYLNQDIEFYRLSFYLEDKKTKGEAVFVEGQWQLQNVFFQLGKIFKYKDRPEEWTNNVGIEYRP